MKKNFSLSLLTVILVSAIALTGCGKSKPSASKPTAQSPAQATPTPTAKPTTTPSPTAEPDQPTAEPTATPDPDLVEITDETYAHTMDEILNVPELYFERPIRLEGLYLKEEPEGLGITTHLVYRISDGYGADDDGDGGHDTQGILFIPPEDFSAQDGDWIIVQGILRDVTIDGYPFLALDEAQVTIDNEHRGSDTVVNLH